MEVHIIEEAGYESSLLGLALSFYDHKIPVCNWEYLNTANGAIESLANARLNSVDGEHFWTTTKFEKAKKIALHLAHKKPAEIVTDRDNADYIRAEQKFLRSICVWVCIQAPRGFWSEFDTYTIGMTKQSSSTMHTLDKRITDLSDFEDGTMQISVDAFNYALANYKDDSHENYKDISVLKNNLPEGWLQERVCCTNYAVLSNILNQRGKHRLKYWKMFCESVLAQVEHPELLVRSG